MSAKVYPCGQSPRLPALCLLCDVKTGSASWWMMANASFVVSVLPAPYGGMAAPKGARCPLVKICIFWHPVFDCIRGASGRVRPNFATRMRSSSTQPSRAKGPIGDLIVWTASLKLHSTGREPWYGIRRALSWLLHSPHMDGSSACALTILTRQSPGVLKPQMSASPLAIAIHEERSTQ